MYFETLISISKNVFINYIFQIAVRIFFLKSLKYVCDSVILHCKNIYSSGGGRNNPKSYAWS